MRQRSDYEVFKSSSNRNRRLLSQEELILEVTEALAEAMSRDDVTKTELAQRLGKSKGFVSQILSGGRNLTLRTVADVADALGYRVKVRMCEGIRLRSDLYPVERVSWNQAPERWRTQTLDLADAGNEGAAA